MNEIIVQTHEEDVLIIVLENNKIVEYYEYNLKNMSKIKNVYLRNNKRHFKRK